MSRIEITFAADLPDLVTDEQATQVRDAIRRYREAGATLPAAGPFGGHKGGAGFEATLEAAADA